MICLNNCMPGPVYPLSTERTVSQSCIGAGHEGGRVRGTVSGTEAKVACFCLQSDVGLSKIMLGLFQIFIVFLLPFSGGTKNDVVDGPCVQIHQLWPSVPDPWGLLHQTGKRPQLTPNSLVSLPLSETLHV